MMRRLAIAGVALLALAVAALPIVLTVVFHWDRTRFLASTLGKGSGIFFILAVVYAVWLPATVFGMVYLYDLLGVHYVVAERKKRPSRRQRQRTRAGMEFLRGRPTLGEGRAPRRSGDVNEDRHEDQQREAQQDRQQDRQEDRRHDSLPPGA